MAGRPSSYSVEMADRICARLADGESLRSVCRDADMPDKQTVFSWMRTHPDFLDQYARAKEESADALVDDMLDIADNQASNPVIVDDVPLVVNGEVVRAVDSASVQHAKLRVDTRKWAASKLKPKKYGDKVTNEVTGPDGGPLKTVTRIELVPMHVSGSN